MRSQTCSISSFVACGRMEMIMAEPFSKNKKPTLSSGLVFPDRLYTNATLPGGAKAPKPEAVELGIEAKHRNDQYIENPITKSIVQLFQILHTLTQTIQWRAGRLVLLHEVVLY